MKKQSLLIYNFEPLFQILNEVKINLNFEIINLTKEKFKIINNWIGCKRYIFNGIC